MNFKVAAVASPLVFPLIPLPIKEAIFYSGFRAAPIQPRPQAQTIVLKKALWLVCFISTPAKKTYIPKVKQQILPIIPIIRL